MLTVYDRQKNAAPGAGGDCRDVDCQLCADLTLFLLPGLTHGQQRDTRCFIRPVYGETVTGIAVIE